MQLAAGTEIEAPIEFVFARLSDAATLERILGQRGAAVVRLDGGEGLSEGARWEISLTFRGKEREVTAEVRDYRPPQGYRIESGSGGLKGETRLGLQKLSEARTRLDLDQTVASTTLSARLLLQSMKLARHSIEERLQKKLEKQADRIEKDFRLSV